MLNSCGRSLEYWDRISRNIYGGLGSAIHLFIEFTNWLMTENPDKDLTWCYQHPVSIRFYDKIKSLTIHKTLSFNEENKENKELEKQRHVNYNGYN
jgi:hypothetical protein